MSPLSTTHHRHPYMSIQHLVISSHILKREGSLRYRLERGSLEASDKCIVIRVLRRLAYTSMEMKRMPRARHAHRRTYEMEYTPNASLAILWDCEKAVHHIGLRCAYLVPNTNDWHTTNW